MLTKRFLLVSAMLGYCGTAGAAEGVMSSFTPDTGAKISNIARLDSGTGNSQDGSFVSLVSCSGCASGGCSIQNCDSSCCDASGCVSSGCDSSGCDGIGGCGKSSWLRAMSTGEGLLGLGVLPGALSALKPSEGCFDDFISPMTNPVYFEDPRQVTEARFIFLNHKIPAVLGNPSGRVQLFAMQARLRLTENLSFIATKDGYVVSQSPLLDDGWADLSAGLKYTLYRDAQAGKLLSVGGRFELPTGMGRTLQGNGDGVLDIFATGGTRLGNRSHLLSATGFILPMDSQAENQMWYWSNHLDHRICGTKLYAFTELNWYHYLKDGSAFPLPLAGGDLFNLGSTGIGGQDIVTNAYGMKYKPSRNVETGVAWEFPMTQDRGLLDNRLTADLILRY